MFKNIQIVSRRNNIQELPNQNWTLKTKIVCPCELELGLGESINFNLSESPSLKSIIELYKLLEKRNTVAKLFKLNDYEILIDQQMGKTKIEISRLNWNKTKTILLQKPNYHFSQHLDEFYLNVSNQIFYNTNKEVRNYYGQLIYGDYNKSSEFSIGTKVETVLSENVKTVRSGFIIAEGYSKDWGTCYIIFTEGKKYKKRYRKEDLVKKEDDSTLLNIPHKK